MNLQVRVVTALALLCAGAASVSEAVYAEEIDFGKIDKKRTSKFKSVTSAFDP